MIKNTDPRIQKYLTPYKYGKPVLEGSGVEGAFDCCAVDIPFVFYHNSQFYMLYSGFSGRGYQTALAVSDNLLDWKHKAVILGPAGEGRWDRIGAAGTWIIKESDDLFKTPVLKKIDGKYWMVYHSYPENGYEAGPAEIGLAWTEDEELLRWNRLDKPVFSWRDGEYWERGGLYKACIVQKEDTYFMYYNAKTPIRSWIEQTGAAASKELLHWTRCAQNPLLKVTEEGWDTKFLSDPCVVRDGELWLNYYFAYDMKHAQDGLALSTDLLHWEKVEDPIVPNGAAGTLDETHAHKASIVYYEGKLYHFYCAVRPFREGDKTNIYNEYRTITVACSHPFETIE